VGVIAWLLTGVTPNEWLGFILRDRGHADLVAAKLRVAAAE
jgi:hypothetical protein